MKDITKRMLRPGYDFIRVYKELTEAEANVIYVYDLSVNEI